MPTALQNAHSLRMIAFATTTKRRTRTSASDAGSAHARTAMAKAMAAMMHTARQEDGVPS